jgi:hypothetical protein
MKRLRVFSATLSHPLTQGRFIPSATSLDEIYEFNYQKKVNWVYMTILPRFPI